MPKDDCPHNCVGNKHKDGRDNEVESVIHSVAIAGVPLQQIMLILTPFLLVSCVGQVTLQMSTMALRLRYIK